MAKKLAHISEDHSREQTVYEHLTGTAELAKQFAAAFGAEEDGYLLGLLHDIGKYSDAFQHRLDGGVRVDHHGRRKRSLRARCRVSGARHRRPSRRHTEFRLPRRYQKRRYPLGSLKTRPRTV